MDLVWQFVVVAAVYAAAALLLSWGILPFLQRRLDTDAIDGALAYTIQALLAIVHRAEWVGWEKVPSDLLTKPGKGLIVISNHASGVDPGLLQMPLRRRIRWMMSTDQMLPALQPLWTHLGILPVSYGPADATTFREAIRHVKGGGVIGIFPEGGIARPPREVRPFLDGVGVLVARSKTPVLVALIEGAPAAGSAFKSLITPSHCRVRCLGVLDFGDERDASVIVAKLRQMFLDATGWPANDEPLHWTPTRRKPARSSC